MLWHGCLVLSIDALEKCQSIESGQQLGVQTDEPVA